MTMADGQGAPISIVATGFRVTPMGAPGDQRRGNDAAPAAAISEDEAIAAALAAAEFQVVATLAVDVDQGALRRGEESELRIDVPVSPGEAAVLLVEDASGLLRWELPPGVGSNVSRRSWGDEPAVQSFVIVGAGSDADSGRRGFVGDWILDKVTEPVRVHVLRFLARRSIDAVTNHIEGAMPIGPVLVDGADPLTWTIGDLAGARQRLKAGEPARVLLLVHGTFSNTATSFSGLVGHALLQGYDLVLGYDHRTLAEEPTANAEAILAMLHALALPEGSSIDAIAFSRGGLVLRTLIEQLLPRTPLSAAIDKAVFVGCTNAGTLLAEPDNWRALLDIYTNILVAAAHIGAAVTGTVAAQPFISGGIRLMGGFAQMLSQVAISERYLPGLAAMEPDGALVGALNTAAASGGACRYFVVSNEFEPSGSRGGLAWAALDRLADRLYGGNANDLVVHTASMGQFGSAAKPVGEHQVAAAGIYHTIYFSQSEVRDQIAAWLDPKWQGSPVGAAPEPEPEPEPDPEPDPEPVPEPQRPPEPRYDAAVDYGGGGGGGFGGDKAAWAADNFWEADRVSDDARRGEDDGAWERRYDRHDEPVRRGPASIDWDAIRPPSPAAEPPTPAAPPVAAERPTAVAASAAAPADAAAPATTERYVAAEMTPVPTLDKPASVYVTISPDAIVVADHAAAAALVNPVRLDAVKPLEVEVIALANCEVLDPHVQQVDPSDPDEVVRKFKVKGLTPGEAELRIEARQHNQTVAAFSLKPIFVDVRPRTLRGQAEAATPIKVASKGRVVLRIYEFKTGNDNLRLQFNLTSDDPELADLQLLAIDGAISLDKYTSGLLQRVERAWKLRQGGDKQALYNSFLLQLTAAAKEWTNGLMPEPIRRTLWKFRKDITAIQIISSEPYIPWELAYLSDPDGQEKSGQGFLAEWGLTRWLHDAPANRRRRAFDEGTCSYVIPDYADARTKLAGAVAERDSLIERFGAAITEIPATSQAVADFLETGATNCALLHFACHGRVKQDEVIGSELLLLSQQNERGEAVPDTLTWEIVSDKADFGTDGGPLVFINACQTGQQGAGIVGPAGFARAFLRPSSRRGAAAFIGALWSVDDKLANAFAKSVYAGLENGCTLGEAVKAAREACKTQNDFTWLAYTVFGN
ncbi:CHAT domain-containing protein [Sphingomonas sp. PB2P19]|uniref:DUF7379 domain-containing protein n=1 Tax=Sphingomonas rhamnosi TaxID=3096156 RepID=UPI002FC78A71